MVVSVGNAEGGPAGPGLLGVLLAFGLAVVAMAYTIGGISGYHINPAIIIAQMTGAVVGAIVPGVMASGHPNSYGENGAMLWKLTGEDKG
jgi:glycerol uptake facilitator-like aquaporin